MNPLAFFDVIHNYTPKFFKQILKTFGIMFIAVSSHWAILYIYTQICVPQSFSGIFVSMMTLGSPVCTFLNKLQYTIVDNYVLIWTGVMTSMISYITAFR